LTFFGEPRVVDRDTIVIPCERNRLEGHHRQGRRRAEAKEPVGEGDRLKRRR
jgi:hypothetical protein